MQHGYRCAFIADRPWMDTHKDVPVRPPPPSASLQAICSRYGLSIGGHAAPAVQLLMWLTAPISWPIGKALDSLLGKENVTFGKRQIRALVDLHRCALLNTGSSSLNSRGAG
jgi:hypothetical protein